MAPIFTGALMPKKKSELQDIAIALRISDQGTKDEILNRIKKHLELNPDLEEDSSFAGLFGNRRKRSVQPQSSVPSARSASITETAKPSSRGRRVVALDPVRESTPNNDLRDVSMFLKHPASPFESTPNQSPLQDVVITPSSLPPLPPSPAKSLMEHIPAPPDVDVLAAKIKDNELLRNSMEMLERFRAFLSNSRNIWSLTAVAEILYILNTVIPWRTYEIPLYQLNDEPVKTFSLHYPPWGVFQTYAFWMVILHWALPTLIIPAIVGNLISFNPKTSPRQQISPDAPAPFDPLTAAIIRLAAQVGYPFATLDAKVQGIDVLGFRWRVLNASVGLAFAFAEAIAGTPQVFAKTLVTEQRHDRLLEGPPNTGTLGIRRRAIIACHNLPLTSPMSSNESLIRDSFRSASSLMGLQLFSRIFTFILNQAMFRMAPPRAYGTAAIQFELLLSTILFLSREGVRNALLRVKKTGPATRNVSVLPMLLGFPLALASAYLYAHFAGSEVRSQEYFTVSIGIYALAALLELMSEPMHNLAMSELRTGLRVKAEGLGITSKTLVTFLVLVYDLRTRGDGSLALVAFAAGQLAYGASVLATYVAAYGTRNMWLRRPPPTTKPTHYFDPEIFRLSLTMTSQSVIKHFLTEGDKLILSWFSQLQDQGGYAVAVNYGSLVARIVFQPIEEASRGFFSKVLGNTSSTSAQDANQKVGLQQSATALVSLLSVQAAFSAVLLVFGTAYIPIFLQILLPRQYLVTSAPQVLSAWVWYIPVLAFNGGLEAFLSSVATPRDLNSQSRWMAAFSVFYIMAAVTFFRLGLGDAALVYANILNLSVRIIYTATFITSFFAHRGARRLLQWKAVLPSTPFLLSVSVSAILIRISGNLLKIETMTNNAGRISLTRTPVLLHIGSGAVLGLANVGVWWISSGRHLSLPRGQHPKSQ
ncbi:Rft protein-domain-containing protein [Lyophyllum atratum]|nr:Rft protein-domain-containing protein [Lyophyllum atratum]